MSVMRTRIATFLTKCRGYVSNCLPSCLRRAMYHAPAAGEARPKRFQPLPTTKLPRIRPFLTVSTATMVTAVVWIGHGVLRAIRGAPTGICRGGVPPKESSNTDREAVAGMAIAAAAAQTPLLFCPGLCC